MGETLGISHNVFEKAERERDRKERLKALEDWKKEKNIRLKRASLYANKHRTQSAQLAATLAAKTAAAAAGTAGEHHLPSRSSVVSLPNDHGQRGGGDVGGGGGGAESLPSRAASAFKEEDDGAVGTFNNEEPETIHVGNGEDDPATRRVKSGSTKSAASASVRSSGGSGKRRSGGSATAASSTGRSSEEKDGDTSCACVIL